MLTPTGLPDRVDPVRQLVWDHSLIHPEHVCVRADDAFQSQERVTFGVLEQGASHRGRHRRGYGPQRVLDRTRQEAVRAPRAG